MSAIMLLALLMGAFFGIAGYFVFLILQFEQPFLWALIAGSASALVLYPVFRFHEKLMERRYKRFEAGFSDPVLFSANGNIRLGKAVRNANLYFFAEKLMFVSLDEKPHLTKELTYDQISRIAVEVVDVHIHTVDGSVYSVKTADAAQIAEELRRLRMMSIKGNF